MKSILLLILLPVLISCSDPEPILIGFVGGLSGRVADLGIAGRNGVILATEQLNHSGGIKGRRIDLLIRDDQQNPAVAQAVVSELLEAGVIAIVGHMTSSMSVSTLPLMNQAKTVMLSPTTTTTELSGIDDYFFRTLAATDLNAAVVADYLTETGIKTVAAIYDQRNLSYTGSWLRDFSRAFERQGGQVIARIGFESGSEIRFSKLAEQIINSEAEAILSVANALDTAFFAQQLRIKDSQLPLVGCEWAATEKVIALGGAAVEGMIIDHFMDRDDQRPAYLNFRSNYRTRFAEEPGFAALAAYEAANALFTALGQSTDPAKLKQTLLKIGTFSGVQGDFQLDAFGDSNRPTFLARIENGKFKRIK